LIHELVHILEDNHGEEFIKLMDQFLPNWRYARDLLNTAPLAHANWDY
jgi:predicted metal-dependent hydrolase